MPSIVYVIILPIVLSLLFGAYLISLDRSPFLKVASMMTLLGLMFCTGAIEAFDFVSYLRSDSEIPLRGYLWDSSSALMNLAYAFIILAVISREAKKSDMRAEETWNSGS